MDCLDIRFFAWLRPVFITLANSINLIQEKELIRFKGRIKLGNRSFLDSEKATSEQWANS